MACLLSHLLFVLLLVLLLLLLLLLLFLLPLLLPPLMIRSVALKSMRTLAYAATRQMNPYTKASVCRLQPRAHWISHHRPNAFEEGGHCLDGDCRSLEFDSSDCLIGLLLCLQACRPVCYISVFSTKPLEVRPSRYSPAFL